MEFGLPVAIASMIFGGTNAVFSIRKHYSTSSKHDAIKNAISSYKPIPKYSKKAERVTHDHVQYHKRLIETMDIGEVILSQIRAKFIKGLIVVLAYVILSSIFIGFDFENLNVSETAFEEIEIFDIFILITYLLPLLIFNSNLILDDDEKEFLKSFNLLNKKFYEVFVRDSIKNFNQDINNYFSGYTKEYKSELDELSEKINEIKKRLNFE